jgi:hypothetical protein
MGGNNESPRYMKKVHDLFEMLSPVLYSITQLKYLRKEQYTANNLLYLFSLLEIKIQGLFIYTYHLFFCNLKITYYISHYPNITKYPCPVTLTTYSY